MNFLRIAEVKVRDGFTLQLTLTDGSVIQRDIEPLLHGALFEPLRNEPNLFKQVQIQDGTIVWPNGADLCPDVLIWGGAPPKESGVLVAEAG